MKKQILLFCMILALLLSLAACKTPSGDSNEHPIKALREEIEAAQSYQLTFEFTDVPELNSFSATVKIDGDKTYTEDSDSLVKQYTERVGNVLYLYEQGENGWEKKTLSEESHNAYISENDFDTLFDENNYVLAEGTERSYVMTDTVSLKGLDNVVLTVTDEGCIITAAVIQNDLSMQAKITVTNIGKTSIVLPEA